MILIEKVLISSEVLECRFSCNINECKGLCCCEGCGGAPLEPSEIPLLQKILPSISGYMRKTSVEKVKRCGFWNRNIWGTFETLLDDDGWCIFAVEKDGIINCSIEAAWSDKKIDFRKPVSCHLYPVRIRRFGIVEGLVYEHWDICRFRNDENSPFLYEFVSDALIRKYGNDFFDKLSKLGKGSIRNRIR